MAKKPVSFLDLVTAIMRREQMTAYRLHQLIRARDWKVSQQTVLNFCAGKPVRSDTLEAIFDTLGIVISEGKR